MFSYLRPHRRTPSNSSSPVHDQAQSWDAPLHRAQDVNIPHRQSQTASFPPLSQPTSRTFPTDYDGSTDERRRNESIEVDFRSYDRSDEPTLLRQHYSPPEPQRWTPRPTAQLMDLEGYREGPLQSAIRDEKPNTYQNSDYSSRQQNSINTSATYEIQSNQIPTGRIPTGARMPTPPPLPAANNISTFDANQSRSGKARLNLLNPMSLLARRRTSQAVPQLSPIPTNFQTKQSDSYDPRIRGTRVHDFSAPRPRRNVSQNDIQDLRSTEGNKSENQRLSVGQNGQTLNRNPEDGDLSPWNGGRHTPIFTEDFNEQQYPAAGPNVRKLSDLADLELPRPPYAGGAQVLRGPEKQQRTLESNVAQVSQISKRQSQVESQMNSSPSVPPKDISKPQAVSVAVERNETSIDKPPKNVRGYSSFSNRSRKVSDVSVKDASIYGLPKHMKSTSSRFSFDMIGAAEQERLLEDRHRQKALEKKSSSPEQEDEDERYVDDEEDHYDYDNMDDDDGLEERIPGVNADAEDEEELDEGLQVTQGMSEFTFHSMDISVGESPIAAHTPTIVSTPRDQHGEVIGFAISKTSPELGMSQDKLILPEMLPKDGHNMNSSNSIVADGGGLGLTGVDYGEAGHIQHQVSSQPRLERGSSLDWRSTGYNVAEDDDDLYFDDGLIDQLENNTEAVEFDESVFDNEDTDQYGRPLSSLPTLYSPPFIQADTFRNANESADGLKHNSDDLQYFKSGSLLESLVETQALHHIDTIEAEAQIQATTPPLEPAPSLTQDTLNAYQSALAAAAHTAAANGRFRRGSSPTFPFDDSSDTNDVRPPDLSRAIYSHGLEDDFDYDDALDDDAIIAEANAEALANDSDGFYGQEFGFYSAPAGEAQYSNGGYFGVRGADGLMRSQSGRVAGREPNLTPITERSEYSNRNSIMSLQPGYASVAGPGSLNSPGLAQLAGMLGEHDDEDMSLSALLKLRRGAWGGSQASLRSSQAGSPLNVLPGEDASPSPGLSPWGYGSSLLNARNNGTYGNLSDAGRASEEASSSPASPTVTVDQAPKPVQYPMAPPPLPSNVIPAPPAALTASLQHRPPVSPTTNLVSAVGLVSPTNEQFDKEIGYRPPSGTASDFRRHRHTGSSDSISYMKEDDPVQGERWVLERRRTAESGEVEILGREVVLGGRI